MRQHLVLQVLGQLNTNQHRMAAPLLPMFVGALARKGCAFAGGAAHNGGSGLLG